MVLTGVTLRQLEAIVRRVSNEYSTSIVLKDGIEWRGGRNGDKVRVKFTLRLEDSGDRFHRRGQSTGRRMIAVCWHGHAIVLNRVFRVYPAAKLKTSVARYSDRGDFNKKFVQTGERNIGSLVRPLEYREACDCHNDSELMERIEGELYDDNKGIENSA